MTGHFIGKLDEGCVTDFYSSFFTSRRDRHRDFPRPFGHTTATADLRLTLDRGVALRHLADDERGGL